MNSNNYTKAVEIAEESVKNINDPKIKLVAFETILKDLLSKNKKVDDDINILTKTYDFDPQKKYRNEKTTDTLKSKFANEIGTDISNVDLIYNVNEENQNFSIVCDFQHNTGKWSQISFVLLYLFGNYIITKKRKSLSLPIIRQMKDYGFGALPNISAYMKTVSPSIVHVKTKKKKSENTYELSDRGVKAAISLCDSIIKNNGIVPLEPAYLSYLPKKVRKSRTKSPLAISILNQITDGFFDKPRTVQELKAKLEEKGKFYDRGIIDEKLRRRFLGKELKRLKINKKWHYVKND